MTAQKKKADVPMWAAIPGVLFVIVGVISLANGGGGVGLGWLALGVILLVSGLIIKEMRSRDQRD